MDQAAAAYLADTLAKISECNGGAAGVLSPFKVEGDGSCMFHAVSRALFGSETFYHVLRRKCAEELAANKAWYGGLSGAVQSFLSGCLRVSAELGVVDP